MSRSLINVLFTEAQRKVIADLLPHLSDRLKLDQKDSRTVSFTKDDLETIEQKAKHAFPHAENGMIRNSLWHIGDAISKAIENASGIGSIPPSKRLYQFKITLLDIEPTIWRRIQIKDCTLDKLHKHIQTAMSWENAHLHDFRIDGERFADPVLFDDGSGDFQFIDSTMVKISKIVPKSGERFRFLYRYDMGACWEHEILFEGCLAATNGQRYPLCLEGEMNCPPEDIGGFIGYGECLDAIADPTHEMHEDFMEWAADFDPKEFDAEKATKKMRRGLPNWREDQ